MARLNRWLQVKEMARETRRIAKIVIFGYSGYPGRWSYWSAEKRIYKSLTTGVQDVFYRGYEHRQQLEDAASKSGLKLAGDDFDLLFLIVRNTWRWYCRAMREALCTHPSYYEIEEDPDEYPGLMQVYCTECGGAIHKGLVNRHTVEELQYRQEGK